MITEVLSSPAAWIFAFGTVFTGGGVFYMANETNKRVRKLEDSKVECKDCNHRHDGLCTKLTTLVSDTKENTKLLHELVGELRHLNGKG